MSQLQVNWSALDQGAELAAQGQAALADAAERIADIRRQLAQELLIGLEFSMLDQRKRRIERFQKSFEDLNRVLGTAADRYRHVEKSNAYRLTGDGTDPNRGISSGGGGAGSFGGGGGGGGFRIPVPEAVGAGTIAAGVISSGGSFCGSGGLAAAGAGLAVTGGAASFEASGCVASGMASGSGDNWNASGDYQFLTGGVRGTIESGWTRDGVLDPHIHASGEVGGSVVTASGNARYGNDEAYAFVNGKGDLLHAEGRAKVDMGRMELEHADGTTSTEYGVSGEIGGEAYLASGEINTGFEICGIRVTIGAEGYAGGIGASASGKVTTGGASGSIGVGAGFGGKVEISVDWGKFADRVKKQFGR